ncbi:tol-pal system protein YbgF [Acanthopleuribacter pedis]|uniref:Tol-pal system protein YbgF n=1 Tax=Acanthopleuribacter pedis TaxID=442870 RepID=A0A8J7U3Y5_9BACT|nr:tol-pal system protein YbgF [Acanthopleuribacter pedis]MBO1320928.1 tol-pal system protein YbgF [Acanthopleuribacter pedis]
MTPAPPHLTRPFRRLLLTTGSLCLAASSLGCFERKAQIDPSILQLQERIILLELKIKEAEHKIARLEAIPSAEHQTTQARTDTAANTKPEATAYDEPESPPPPVVETLPEPSEETRVADGSATQPEPAQTKEKSATQTPEETAPLVEMGVYNVADKYREAYDHYNQRRYSEAKAIYQNIAENHRTHKLAANAFYWWGEVEYDRGNFNQAILAFQRLLDRFPKSHKVPDALLKLGKSRERLGQISEAREDYNRVITRYPDSRAATIAKSWL